MKKVIVIGSNSFSGSDFIDLLLEKGGYDVVGVSRSKEKSELFLPYKRHHNGLFRYYQIDINKDFRTLFDLLDDFKPTYVVNFAAQSEVGISWDYPEQWFETNAVGIAKLANFLKDKKYMKKYVHISSPEVYGSCSGNIDESAPINPSTPYAASKAAGDLFLFTLVKNFKFPLVMIRSTNVYGAHQQLFKIIPRTIIFSKLGKQIELHGGGRAIKSYIHIRDVSRGELAAMEKGKSGEIYHLSPDEYFPVKDVVTLIRKRMKLSTTKGIKIVGERLGQDAAYIIDSTKARKILGWKPKISLKEGIDEMIGWIDENWDEIKRQPLEYIHKP